MASNIVPHFGTSGVFLLAGTLIIRRGKSSPGHRCLLDSKTDMSASISERINSADSSVMPVIVAKSSISIWLIDWLMKSIWAFA